MTGAVDIAILVIILVGVGVAGFVLRMVVNGLMTLGFVVVVLLLGLAVWVPGPLEPLLLPVQVMLRIPFSLVSESLGLSKTVSVGLRTADLIFR